nr:transposase family protein [Shewanella sp. MEBiC00475]
MSTTLLTHLNSIADLRIERCKKHQLIDILLLVFNAVLPWAECWADIDYFYHLKLDWLKIR